MQADWAIYIINLDRSPDRLVARAERLEELGLTFERVTAVDGSTLTLPHPALDEPGFLARHGKSVRINELGCYLSHVAAIQRFLESDYAYAVILEDDAALDDAFPKVVEAATAQGDLWDMLKLNRRHDGLPKTVAALLPTHDLVAYRGKQSGAVGYLLNRKAAQALVDRLLPMRVPYDHEFDRGHEHGFRVRGVIPPVVHDDPQAGSDIGYGYETDRRGSAPKRRKLPFWKRLPTYAYRSREAVRRLLAAL